MKARSGLDIALGFALTLLFAAFVAAVILAHDMPQGAQAAILLSIVFITVALGVVSQVRKQRRLDEMEVAALRFGALWSPVAVSIFIALAVFLPSVQSALVGFGAWNEARFEAPGTGGLAPAASMFVFGGVAALLVQMIAQAVLRAAWTYSKR